MTITELIERAEAARRIFGPSLEVEVATSPRNDEWYEIADTEIAANCREADVFVINTD